MKILCVVTRDYSTEIDGGRHQMIGRVIGAIGRKQETEVFYIKSLLQQKSFAMICRSVVRRILICQKGKRWPLQCVLFDDDNACRRLEEKVERDKPTAILFDTVRCFHLIQRIAQKYPNIVLVCDFDDLMSRRMRLVRELKQKVELGYIGQHTPEWVRRLLKSRTISNFIQDYEASSLSYAETEIARLVSRIVLLSTVDAQELGSMIGREGLSEVEVIPPPFVRRKRVVAQEEGIRFVFIGSDRQLQNRLSIKRLLDIWSEHKIPYPLYIYGRQSVSKVEAANVFWPGFAETLEEVYTPKSILLAPAILGGGLKTKMLEALEYGCIPLGNRTSFEGISVNGSELVMSDSELLETLKHLPVRLPELLQSAQRLQDYQAEYHGVDSFDRKWQGLFNLN